MKKAMAIAVMTAFIVSLSGCGNTDYSQSIQSDSEIEVVTSETDDSAKSEESLSVSVSDSNRKSGENSEVVEAETESVQSEVSNPIAERSPAEQTQQSQTAVPKDTPNPELPKTIEPTPEPEPASTQPPAEEQQPVEQPQETTSTHQEPAAPEFNIQTWIDYAKTYAVNVGLRLESSATDCWDNPITAGAYSSYLERDIQSRLDRYSRDDDITDVWIWAEARSDGSYDWYIGYA